MNTTSLRITLVTETFPSEINGVANTLGHLSEGLRTRGHQVEIIRPHQAADERSKSGDQLLLCHGWPIPRYPGLQWGHVSVHKLIRRWRRSRPDVLYIATEGPLGLSALRAARRLNIPIVSGFHTNFQQYTHDYRIGFLTRALTGYLRWFHNRTALTLVPSATQRHTLERRGFDRLALLSRGVDSQLFSPARRSAALRESWGLGPDDIALIHVGRLAAEKNLGLLKRCLDTLQLDYPLHRLRLVVIGDGPQRGALAQQTPSAVFCGAKRGEELAVHYASGDVFLFPSLSETFGNVVLEALASGLGVVAYDEAAAAQHIRHGHNGALAMPGDEMAFIEAAGGLVGDSEALRRVRLNARQHARRQGWGPIIEQFETQLRSACQATAQPVGGFAIKPGSSTLHG